MSVKVKDIMGVMERIAPKKLAEGWDNVGLAIGDPEKQVTKILVALDVIDPVVEEAKEMGAEMIVTHHPIIFRPLPNVTDKTSIGRGLMTLCRHGINAVNAHTNLDCAPGGVNDVLAQTLGLRNIEVIPGGIPNLLRMGDVDEQPLSQFLSTVKDHLGCDGLRYVDGGKPVHRVAVGGGACADGMLDAIAAGCDTFVTSDVKYNQFWDAHDLGLNLIDAGHFATENPIIAVLASKLQAQFPEIQVKISESHRDCMKFY